MKKPFDALYAGLQKSLGALEREADGIDRYSRGISVIRDSIREVRALGRKSISARVAEVAFFREVWPAFYGQLFLYVQLHQLELVRRSLPADAVPDLLAREEGRVTAFFGSNREFWAYYRGGAGILDEQFTRAYSQARLFDVLAPVIDQEGATLASYRAAWCLAMEGYGARLASERERLSGPSGPIGDYSWGAADTDFVEWLFGLQAVGAIRYKGQPADISRVIKWGRWALGKEVVNTHDRFKIIRNRKKQRMTFTKRTEAALEVRMDEKDGKYA